MVCLSWVGIRRRPSVVLAQGALGRQRKSCGTMETGAKIPRLRSEVLMDNERIREICPELPQPKEAVNRGHHLLYWAGERDHRGHFSAKAELDGTGTGV